MLTDNRLKKIRARAEAATPDLIEEPNSPGWVISKSLSPAGCRVYSPQIGINFKRDYDLFMNARTDILDLCAEIDRLRAKLQR